MTTTQLQRIEASQHHRNTAGDRPPPDPIDPANSLSRLDPSQVDDLVNALLEDWDCPTMTELGLCRAHGLTLAQVLAVARLPKFQRALADLRAIRTMRQPDREAAARDMAIDRLSYLAKQTPTSATHAKEIRLAIKQLLALIDPPKPRQSNQRPTPGRDAGAPNHSTPDTRPPTPKRGGAGDPSPAHANQTTPAISDITHPTPPTPHAA